MWERKPLKKKWIIPHFYDVTGLIFETLCPVTSIVQFYNAKIQIQNKLLRTDASYRQASLLAKIISPYCVITIPNICLNRENKLNLTTGEFKFNSMGVEMLNLIGIEVTGCLSAYVFLCNDLANR